jgi:hypothetical protein
MNVKCPVGRAGEQKCGVRSGECGIEDSFTAEGAEGAEKKELLTTEAQGHREDIRECEDPERTFVLSASLCLCG